MVSLAIEVQDMANVHNLMVVPSPRRVPTARRPSGSETKLPASRYTPSGMGMFTIR